MEVPELQEVLVILAHQVTLDLRVTRVLLAKQVFSIKILKESVQIRYLL